MAPITPALSSSSTSEQQSHFFSDSSCAMQNSLSSAAANGVTTATTTAVATAAEDKKTSTLESLSMTLPSRSLNDYVEDTAKLDKMAAAVKVLLEVRFYSM